MARRRPPRPASFILLAACCLVGLTPQVWSSQQQEYHLLQQQPDASDIGRLRQQQQQPPNNVGIQYENKQFQHVKDTIVESNDLSALQTFAPARHNTAGLAVRAPSPAQASGKQGSAGFSSLLHARSLQDWEVEDLILLATVDGSIYARDRKTGAHKWGPILAESPAVETIHYRQNASSGLQHQYDDALSNFLWIVEPVRGGEIYLYNKAQHGVLRKLHMTVKDLQDKTPHASEEPPVVYYAEKTVTLISFDAATGEWRRSYGAGRSQRNDKTTCRVEGFGGYKEQECGLMGSLVLGRITYTIHIEHRETMEPICTIKYSEWVPNVRDGDLHMQYKSSMDQRYVYSRHDGRVLALKHDSDNGKPQQWSWKLPSPVVRVFDIAKPAHSDSRDTELVVLPQPIRPMASDAMVGGPSDANRVFVNHTTNGGWYALSEQMYPTVTDGADEAQCYNPIWRLGPDRPERLTQADLEKIVVGVHPLAGVVDTRHDKTPLLPQPPQEIGGSETAGASEMPVLPATPSVVNGYYISKAAVNALGVISLLIAGFIGFCVFYLDRAVVIEVLRKQFAPDLKISQAQKVHPEPSLVADFTESKARSEELLEQEKGEKAIIEEHVVTKHEESNKAGDEADFVTTEPQKSEEIHEVTLEDNVEQPQPDPVEIVTDAKPESEQPKELHVRIVEPNIADDSVEAEIVSQEANQETGPDKEKKKARRGTRGGKAHRRKKKGSRGENEFDEIDIEKTPTKPTTEEVVEKALEINKQPDVMEPDAVTVIPRGSDPTRVDDKTLQIGQLTVFEDKVLGFGSHGTRVFQGSFSGRDVAVKCMLRQLYDIASHEVTVLQESDDHPNVIRYYMMEAAGDFMYIALELCPASLADVIDHPMDHGKITGPGGLDMVDALRQITMGIRYLHSLKIVHRDIKPENILMAAPKKIPTRPDFFQPARLLISDFGLCKKLEVDQSSFRATTAHAAGTSGWRAPELLIDDENEDASRNDGGSGTQYSTNSEPVIVDTSTNRRVTRAIDIFALGCVFYYVLSKGNHPFDGKGRGEGKYMREANIIRGNHTLDDLSVLGAYQGEADDLIGRMLAKKPKDRPDASQVLAHPFFWSAADRLDFLCHVSDQFEFEPRDPPSFELQTLEDVAPDVIRDCRGDFLKKLPADFVATLGKQRKYKGDHMLDLLRALRNKKNHYEDMPDSVKAKVGSLPEGYLLFWTERFPKLLMKCHEVVRSCGWEDKDRFRKYYQAA